MKIRTDFVTNSSSSSFVVEIAFEDEQGNLHSLCIPTQEQDPDGVESAAINCGAAQLAKADSLESLLSLISDSLEVGDEDPDNEYMVEFIAGVKDGFRSFCNDILAKHAQGAAMKSVILKNSWHAWGEGCSCFSPVYLLGLSEDVPELALTICKKDGPEKEAAKEKLAALLKQCPGFGVEGGWSASWPTGFLGVSPAPSIRYDLVAGNIEELAKKILTERECYDTDYAREVVKIDLKSKEISACSEYILGGCAENDPPFSPQDLVSLKEANNALLDAVVSIDPKYLPLEGTFYGKRYDRISKLKPGDKITLRTSNDNAWVGFSIEAFDLQGGSLGYLVSRRISTSKLAQVLDQLEARVAEIVPVEGRSNGNFKFTMTVKLSKK